MFEREKIALFPVMRTGGKSTVQKEYFHIVYTI